MSLDEALGLWAEAAQDMASAGLSRAAGLHFNCADLCNQVAEKSTQAVYLLRHDRRAPYDHDLRALGEVVDAPPDVLAALDALTPYYPGTFLAHTAAELADDAITGETVTELMDHARLVLRWARGIVLTAG